MAQLFETQPEDNEPLEFTHFDCWFWGDNDSDGELHPNFDDDEKVAEMRDEVIKHWDKSLNLRIYDYLRSICEPTTLADEYYWDAVIMYLLRQGYDVFEGETFIEIYKE